jgi:hypothetical protein
MWAYYISSSADLFQQQSQVPNLSPTKHLKALTNRLATETTNATTTPKEKGHLKIIRTHLYALITPPPATAKQWVTASMPTFLTPQMELQRV